MKDRPELSWEEITPNELMSINMIVQTSCYLHGGKDLAERFSNHQLGSYWMIEFRREAAYILRHAGEAEAQKYVLDEISGYFPAKNTLEE